MKTVCVLLVMGCLLVMIGRQVQENTQCRNDLAVALTMGTFVPRK